MVKTLHMVLISKVAVYWAQLLLGGMTVCRQVNHLGMLPPIQPSLPWVSKSSTNLSSLGQDDSWPFCCQVR